MDTGNLNSLKVENLMKNKTFCRYEMSNCLFEDSCVGFAFLTPCLQLLFKVKVDSIKIMLLGKKNLFLNPEFPEC